MSLIRKPFRYCHYNTVFWLIGINVLIFAAIRFLGIRFYYLCIEQMAMIPGMVIHYGKIWTFVTYMFLHDAGGFSHVLFNMLGLFIFGLHVERQMGSKEFLLYYFVTGALAGVFSFIVYFLTGSNVALMGASGALFAVQLAYAVFFPDSMIYIWGILPLRAPVMVLGYTILTVFFIVTGRGGNVAHITHLAGFIFGWLYFLIRFGIDPWRRLTRRGY